MRTSTPRRPRSSAFCGLRTRAATWFAAVFFRSSSTTRRPRWPVAPVTAIMRCPFLALTELHGSSGERSHPESADGELHRLLLGCGAEGDEERNEVLASGKRDLRAGSPPLVVEERVDVVPLERFAGPGVELRCP